MMCLSKFPIFFILCCFFVPQLIQAQTVIYSNGGTSYNNTDAVTTNNYGPVDISNCSSISMSVHYNFSLPFPGGGNMESSDECPFSGGCAGDPNDPYSGGCSNCWDFFYVQFQIDGVTVNTQIVGVPGSLNQTGTLSYGPVCTNGASTATMIIQTNTWAANESITFNNITITCWDASSTLSVNPDPICSGLPFTLNSMLTSPTSVASTVWTGPGTITTPGNLSTTVTGPPVGTNTYTFTATDKNACTKTNTIDQTVTQGPTLNAPPNITVCPDDPVDVTFSGTGNAPTYTWTNSNIGIGLGANGMGDLSFTAANVAATTVGTITVTPSENGCTGPNQSFTITVNPAPSILPEPDVAVCAGILVTNGFIGPPGTTFNWVNDNPNIGLGAAGSVVGAGTFSFTAAAVGNQELANITVTPTLNGCVGTPILYTITVNPAPSVMDPADETACAGDPVEVFFSGSVNPNFSWTNSNPAIGLGGSGMGDISFTTANVGAPTTGTITVTPNEAGCPGPAQTFTITVNPIPSLNPPNNVEVCAGAGVQTMFAGSPGATFNWDNDNPAIGLGASGSGNLNFTTANVAVQEIANITVTPVNNGCPGNPQMFTITVNPAPIVIDPADQTACAGELVEVLFSGSVNPNFNWTNNNPAIGLGPNGTGDISFTTANVGAPTTGTITVTPNEAGCPGAAQTFTITVTPVPSVNQPADVAVCAGAAVVSVFTGSFGATFNWTNDNPAIGLAANGLGSLNFTTANVAAQEIANITVTPTNNGCPGNPISFTITVNPAPTVSDPADQTVCAGDPVEVLFSGNLNPVFNWSNNNPLIGLGPNGSGDISFTAANVINPSTGTITVTPNEAGCPGTAQTFTLTVSPMPSVDQPNDITVCAGAAVVSVFTGSFGASFSWTNDNPAIGLAANGLGSLNFTAANVTMQEIAHITITPMNNACPGSPLSFTITVNPTPTLIPPADQTICSGTPVSVVFSGTNHPNFNWVNNNPGIGLAASGTGDLSFVATNVGVGTITVTPTANSCAGPAQMFDITVVGLPVLNQTPDLNACAGSAVSINFSGTTGAAFSWTNSNPLIGLNANGTGNISFTAANVATATSGTISVTPNLAGCIGMAQTFELTIQPLPTITINSVSCASDLLSYSINLNTSGTQIMSSAGTVSGSNGNFSINDIPAGTNVTITSSVTATGCQAQQSVNAPNCNCAPVTAASGPNAPVICEGAPNPTLSVTAAAGTTIDWYAAASGGAPLLLGSATYTPVGVLTPGVYTFYAEARDQVSDCLSSTRLAVTLTVNALPTVQQPLDQSVCAGTQVAVNFTGTGSAVMNWSNSNSNIGLGANGSGDISFLASNVGNTPLVANLVVTPSLNGCPGAAQNFKITVNPIPGLSAPADLIVCGGAPVSINFSGTSGAALDWTNSNPGIGLGASGTGNIIFVAANVLTPTVANIAVTPSLAGCTGLVQSFSLSFDPTPSVTAPADQSVCAGTPVAVNFAGSVSAIFSWTNSNPNIGLGASGTGDISFPATNSGNTPFVANLVVTPSLNGCTGADQNFSITVNPIPNLTLDSITCSSDLSTYTIHVSSSANTLNATAGTVSGTGPNFDVTGIPAASNVLLTVSHSATGCMKQQTVNAPNCNCAPVSAATTPNNPSICAGAPNPALTVTTAPGITVDWYDAPSGGALLWMDNASYTPAGVLAPGTYSFYAEAREMASACTSTTRLEVILTVKAVPSLMPPADQSVCAGTQISVNFSGSASAAFDWTNADPNIGLGANGTGDISFLTTNTGSSPLSSNLVVTPMLNGCAGMPQNFVLTVNPIPTASISGNALICNGTGTTLTAMGGSSIHWSNGANTPSISVIPANSSLYTVTVTENGCTASASITVNVQQPSASTLHVLSCDPAVVGTTITVIPNAAGCDSTITTITTLDNSACAPAPQLSNGLVSCFGNADGVLSLSASNGLAPYQYAWSNGTQSGSGQIPNVGGSIQLQNLAAGTYTVTITGSNGLSTSATAVVSSPALLTAQANAQLVLGQYALLCNGASDATISATVSGGSAPYQYAWSVPGQQSPILTKLGAGAYALTVTDAHLCTATGTVQIQEPPALQFGISLTTVPCGENTASALITPANGLEPFSVQIDGVLSSGGLMPGIPVGNHLVEIQDANGCTADTVLSVDMPLMPIITLPAEAEVTQGETLVLEAQTNLTSWQNLVWNPSLDSSCLNCLRQEGIPANSGIYRVVITDQSGCTASASVRVLVKKQVNIYVPNVFSPNGDGENDFWTIHSGAGVSSLKSVQIFDRWGDMVYQLTTPVPPNAWSGWDGSFRGQALNPGVFVFYLEVALSTGEIRIQKGDLMLIR